jgi:uncharacterized membrane protein YuzA (DUF378 family)
MRSLNLITLLLAIVGAINWGLVGAFDFNLVSAIFGANSFVSNLIYILVGLSGLYQLVPFFQAISNHQPVYTRHTHA